MKWTRTQTLALAQQRCTQCYGLGLRPGRNGEDVPCNCVFRAIFRACYARFQSCANDHGQMGRVIHDRAAARKGKHQYSMKSQEFVADFLLIAKRVLGETSEAYKLFKFHFLLGADWRLCSRKLGIDRGEFFHEVYRVQQKLGRAYAEVAPYALFPLDEYFGGVSVKHQRPATILPTFAVPIFGSAAAAA